jgi:protein disulfide-isomerase
MKPILKTTFAMAFGGALLGAFAVAPAAAPSATPASTAVAAPANLPYDESAVPASELPKALSQARAQNKRVLIVFGANWCPDCRELDKEIHAGGELTSLVDQRYVVLKVDVGHFDKNLDFTHLYGTPTGKGIPSVVVVTPKNEVVYETRAGELADARDMGHDGIYNFFKELADKPAGY